MGNTGKPFDLDLAAGTLSEACMGSLTAELSKLVEMGPASGAQETHALVGEFPRMPKNDVELARLLALEDPKKGVAALLTGVIRDWLENDFTILLPALMRDFLQSETVRSRAFCAAIITEVSARDSVGLAHGRDPMILQVVSGDNCRFSGELISYSEKTDTCIVESENDGSAMFTYGVPLRDIKCLGLPIDESSARDAWNSMSTNLAQQFGTREREKSIDSRYKALREVMGADALEEKVRSLNLKEGEEPEKKRTLVQFQLKGGSKITGELVAVNCFGCLVGDGDMYFIPYESIAIHGILSERYDEFEMARAKHAKLPIPDRIERKRREALRNQLSMGHDEDFLR